MKKILLSLFIVILSHTTLQASSFKEELSPLFTAEETYLERLQNIKSTLESPDHFSKELAELAAEFVAKVKDAIPSEDKRYKAFSIISDYAKTEISEGTLTLNRLNYLTFQLSVAMNPNLSSPHEIFEGIDLLIQNQIWMLSYDKALKGIKGYIEENLSEADPTEFESPQNLVMTIFRPCDRGQWVFPLVSDNPIYGLRTYSKAFASGISITGLPLIAENCGVHAGLIKKGEFAYFLIHDLLHNQSLAPSIDPKANSVHMGAMTKATSAALSKIEKLSIAKQRKAYGLLFLVNHELVDYSEDDVKLFNGTESAQEAFAAMLEHSKAYVARQMHKALDSRETYYPYYSDVLDHGKEAPFIGDKPFTVHNEDGSEEIYLDKTSINYAKLTGKPIPKESYINVKNKSLIRVTEGSEENSPTSAYFINNIFYSWPVQRAFIFSQVKILKFSGIDDGEKTYGATLEKFKPSVANKIILDLLSNFNILEE